MNNRCCNCTKLGCCGECLAAPPPVPKPDDAMARARDLIARINHVHSFAAHVWRPEVAIVAAALRAERTRALEDAAKVIETTVHAIANPLKSKFTAEDMRGLRRLCVEMWAADIRALKAKS